MSETLDVFCGDAFLCGEAPTWDPDGRALVWVDQGTAKVFRQPEKGGVVSELDGMPMVAGLARNRDRSWVLAGSTGLHLWSEESGLRAVLQQHAGEALFFNDILADAGGRIYAGTCYWNSAGMEKPGKLYLIAADGSAEIVDDDIELSNGLGLSGDGRTLYYSDSTRRTIFAYDVDLRDGRLSNRRSFVQVPASEGLPDGLTVDAEDHVWSAQWYGGQIVRYDPDGKVERRIGLPVCQVSSLTFGGSHWEDIYVTTAAEAWSSPYLPSGFAGFPAKAGGPVYRLRAGIKGRPDHCASLSL